jgi:hypothetical protein
MELIQVANYLDCRYLISNLKTDKKALLKGNLLASCSVDSLGTEKQEVTYYDTAEFFFAERGINIYTIEDKLTKELIIRYDSEHVQRIEFLKNTPNFFKVKINNKNTPISEFTKQINEAIYRVFPTGLHVNVDDMLRASSPQIKIMKKSDNYRVVNNIGLKSTISFVDATYINVKNRSKTSQYNLEVVGEASNSPELFVEFQRKIILDCPQLIRLTNNELSLARKNLS